LKSQPKCVWMLWVKHETGAGMWMALTDIWWGRVWYSLSLRRQHVVFPYTYLGLQPEEVPRCPYRPDCLSYHISCQAEAQSSLAACVRSARDILDFNRSSALITFNCCYHQWSQIIEDTVELSYWYTFQYMWQVLWIYINVWQRPSVRTDFDSFVH